MVEGSFNHCVDLFEYGAFVFHRLPAHLGSMVLSTAGGTCGAICRAVGAPVGRAFLFSVALEATVVADATVVGRGSGGSVEGLALAPG